MFAHDCSENQNSSPVETPFSVAPSLSNLHNAHYIYCTDYEQSLPICRPQCRQSTLYTVNLIAMQQAIEPQS
jgi:hypothetical protein